MKKFNALNNMVIVTSEEFKSSIKFAVNDTQKNVNFPNGRFDKSFICTIVTFNPESNKVEVFSNYDFVDFNYKEDINESLLNKLNSILSNEEYSKNELITVIYANEFNHKSYSHYSSNEKLKINNMELENKFLNLYVDIISNKFVELEDSSKLIKDLDLSIRTTNCLYRAGITTVKEVKSMSYNQIINIRNLGMNSLKELEEKLNIKFI